MARLRSATWPRLLGLLLLPALLLTLAACNNPAQGDLTSLNSLSIYTQDWDVATTITADQAMVLDLGRYGELTYNSANFSKAAGSVAYSLNQEDNKGIVVATAQTKVGNLRVYLTQIDGKEKYQSAGIATNVELFGDLHPSRQTDIALLPLVKAKVAAWGKADVYLNGTYIGDFDATFWRGPRIFDGEGKAWQAADKKTFFDPAKAKQAYLDSKEEALNLLLQQEERGYPIRYWHLQYNNLQDPAPAAKK